MSRQRLFFFLSLFLALNLLLVACERSLGGGDEEPTPTTVAPGVETAVPGTGEQPTTAPAVDTPIAIVTETPGGQPPAETTPADQPTPTTETGGQLPTPGGEVSPTVAPTVAPTTQPTPATGDTTTPGGTVTTPTTHVVAAGETLYRIGLRYGVSWVRLAEYNNLSNPNQLTVGQVLQIPGSTTLPPTPSPQTETTYVVKAGDNLFRIGLAYRVSWVQIAEANGIVNPNQIYVGQTLKIPVSTPGPTPQFTHQVKAGETLFLISLQYGIPWTRIAEANNLSSPYVIYVGQTLVIPGS